MDGIAKRWVINPRQFLKRYDKELKSSVSSRPVNMWFCRLDENLLMAVKLILPSYLHML